LHKQVDSERAISLKLGISQYNVQWVLKKRRTLDKWRAKGEVAGLKKRFTLHKQSLKVMSLRNRKKYSKDLTKDQRDTSPPSVDL